MISPQLLITTTAATLVAYLTVGTVIWRAAERRNIRGDTRLLIYGWLPVVVIVAIGAWSLFGAVNKDALE